MNRREAAETLALRALAWVASDEDRLHPFLATSGLGADELGPRAGDPDLLAAVLDFVLAEDARVLALAAELGQPPEAVLRARAALPGGDLPHWT